MPTALSHLLPHLDLDGGNFPILRVPSASNGRLPTCFRSCFAAVVDSLHLFRHQTRSPLHASCECLSLPAFSCCSSPALVSQLPCSGTSCFLLHITWTTIATYPSPRRRLELSLLLQVCPVTSSSSLVSPAAPRPLRRRMSCSILFQSSSSVVF